MSKEWIWIVYWREDVMINIRMTAVGSILRCFNKNN